MKKIMFSVVLALLLLFCAVPVYAVPVLPHAFYGSVTIDGETPDGTLVSATVVDGGVLTNAQNPIGTVGGNYGVDSPRLLVQGDIASGDTVVFWVNDVKTDQTAIFEIGGGPTLIDLVVLIEPEPEPEPEPSLGGGGVTGALPYTYCKTDFCGDTGKFRIDKKGKVLQSVTAGCVGGPLSVTVDKGTIALDKDGKPISTLNIVEDRTPPPPPEKANIIAMPFELGPTEATFDPSLTFTWTYDLKDLPEGVVEEDLVLASYDEKAKKWVELECVVDTKAKTVTAKVSHFTPFALLCPVPEVVVPPPARGPPHQILSSESLRTPCQRSGKPSSHRMD